MSFREDPKPKLPMLVGIMLVIIDMLMVLAAVVAAVSVGAVVLLETKILAYGLASGVTTFFSSLAGRLHLRAIMVRVFERVLVGKDKF